MAGMGALSSGTVRIVSWLSSWELWLSSKMESWAPSKDKSILGKCVVDDGVLMIVLDCDKCQFVLKFLGVDGALANFTRGSIHPHRRDPEGHVLTSLSSTLAPFALAFVFSGNPLINCFLGLLDRKSS